MKSSNQFFNVKAAHASYVVIKFQSFVTFAGICHSLKCIHPPELRMLGINSFDCMILLSKTYGCMKYRWQSNKGKGN